MILIVTDRNDVHTNIVQSKLLKRKESVFRLNLDVQSLKKTTVSFDGFSWVIRQNELEVSHHDISTIWYRRAFVELLLEENENRDADFLLWKNEWNRILLGFYLMLSNKPTLCPIKQSYAAENKFLQFSAATEVGLKIPSFVISNEKKILQQFAVAKNDNVVLKLHSQEFYRVADKFKGIYVNKVSTLQLEDFQTEGENPITLQEYISKKFEVRYTVVGNRHFGCKIDSQSSEKTKIDWRRYDIPNTPHYSLEIPQDIKEKVNELFIKLGINFGALDFIVDSYDQWYFLEVNPMGQWLWIEDLTGLEISEAITDWLCSNKHSKKEVMKA